MVNEIFRDTSFEAICFGDTLAWNGLMLDSTGIYVDTLASNAGCDSIVVLDLMVNEIFRDTSFEAICLGDTLAWNGFMLDSTGIYVDTLASNAGCDSIVVLDLMVNEIFRDTSFEAICLGDTLAWNGFMLDSTGIYVDTLASTAGCDSIVVLDLMVNEIFRDTSFEAICLGDTLAWNGFMLDSTGIYVDTLASTAGCDSIVVLDLMVNEIFRDTSFEAICFGDTLAWNGFMLDSTGIYVDTLASAGGCDSIIILDLMVNEIFRDTSFEAICLGDTLAWNGFMLDSTGVYVDTLASTAGCDSIVVLDLMVNEIFRDTSFEAICLGDTLAWNGFMLDSTGIYVDTLASTAGCDSIVVLDLMVNEIFRDTSFEAICLGDTLTWNGLMLDSTGIYIDTLASTAGCDSIVVLDLMVNEIFHDTSFEAICLGDTLAWNGFMLDSTGIYVDTLASAGGCDSIIILDLMVNEIFRDTSFEAICLGDTLAWNGFMLDSTGIYIDTLASTAGCDSIVVLDLMVNEIFRDTSFEAICLGDTLAWNGFMLDSTGIYVDTLASTAGCDSIVVLDLMVNEIFRDTSFEAICLGDTLAWNGFMLDSTGIYVDTLASTTGCDSIVVLDLMVNEIFRDTSFEAICLGDTLAWNGLMLDSTGIYVDTLASAGGCDSIIILDLMVNEIFRDTSFEAICLGDTLAWNGFMLDSTGIYIDTLATASGCDSIIVLDLMVNDVLRDSSFAQICSGDTFDWNGTLLDTTGIYTDTLATASGCDSIILLDLMVNDVLRDSSFAQICTGETFDWNGTLLDTTGIYTDTLATASGCDSIIVLDLMVNDVLRDSSFAQICSGDTFDWNGVLLDTTGIYTDTLATASGCDSIIVLDLMVNDVLRDSSFAQICSGDTFDWNGVLLDTTGIYTDTLATASGCDSIIVLDLMVNDVLRDSSFAQICSGDTFDWNGTLLDTTGIYTDTLATASGCDSIIVLDLAVNDVLRDSTTASICPGDSIAWNGNFYDMAGIYTDTLSTASGCDSILVLDLGISTNCIDSTLLSICAGDSIVWNGMVYDSAGIYTDTLMAANGQDSIVTLTLDILPTFMDTTFAAICEGELFNWNNTTFDSTGIYVDTLSAMNGCDSILVLDLQVADGFTDTTLARICVGETYTWNGNLYDSTGIYTDSLQTTSGCDSILILDLAVLDAYRDTTSAMICIGDSIEWNGQFYDTFGMYTDTLVSQGGCDSIIVLNLGEIPVAMDTTQAVICAGNSFDWNNMTFQDAGMYTDTLQAAGGCDSIILFLDLQVIDYPLVDAGADQLLDCNTNVVTIGSSVPGPNETYLWAGPGINATNASEPVITVDQAGMYVLSATNQAGCTASDTVMVEIDVFEPALSAGPDQSLTCTVSTVTLTATTDLPNAQYRWTGPGINAGNQNLESLQVDQAGVYTVFVTDPITGCSSDPVELTVISDMNEPVLDLDKSNNLDCNNSSLTLDASSSPNLSGMILEWTDSNGNPISSDMTLTITEPGTYIFTATNPNNGCSASETMTIQDRKNYPVAAAGVPQILDCGNEMVQLNANGSSTGPNLSYAWDTPTGGIVGNADQFEISADAPGWYFVQVTDDVNGCTNRDSVLVEANFDAPIADVDDQVILDCFDDLILLDGTRSSAGPGINYRWEAISGQILSGRNNPSAVTDSPGTYVLNVINIESKCIDRDTIVVIPPNPPTGATVETSVVCFGENNGTISVSNITGGTPPYLVAVGNEVFTTQFEYENLAPGTYPVRIQDAFGCEWTTVVVLEEQPPIEVDLGPDLSIKLGETIQLNTDVNIPFSEIDTIMWDPADSLSCTNCLDPIAGPYETTSFQVTVVDTFGCRGTDDVAIAVDLRPDIYVPNGFSPNGDGTNDRFVIYAGPGIRRIKELKIFDRWGELVFEIYDFLPNEVNFGWDGWFRGKPMNAAVFAWFTIAETIDGREIVLKGDLTLVR
ncbi:hypothetical protein CRP01_38240 [Flavilitoribacter nigricans DSM 23189 = NBRC 102662]|uniref:Ig-like domain-containing protein n=2 Tax=Flavilitoribacter TaxID=2762562 RepID=A0A2D0MZC6_FLAN2|nr:hypothetical protein CRP01_38240 [Flavilitoribacter nigricans DSM 23189 = NBRC 102662]